MNISPACQPRVALLPGLHAQSSCRQAGGLETAPLRGAVLKMVLKGALAHAAGAEAPGLNRSEPAENSKAQANNTLLAVGRGPASRRVRPESAPPGGRHGNPIDGRRLGESHTENHRPVLERPRSADRSGDRGHITGRGGGADPPGLTTARSLRSAMDGGARSGDPAAAARERRRLRRYEFAVEAALGPSVFHRTKACPDTYVSDGTHSKYIHLVQTIVHCIHPLHSPARNCCRVWAPWRLR